MSAGLSLGLVRVGTLELAIEAASIEEIVRGPLEVSPFPQAPWHVLGAFALRGEPVPVVDLEALMRPAAAAATRPMAYAVVLRHETGRCAVQVDEVRGIAQATPDRIAPLASRSGDGLFSRVFTPREGGRVATLLDLDAVLAADGVRTAALAPVRERRAARAEAGPPLVLFRAGGACLAVAASAVAHVQARPAQLDSPLENAWIEGFQLFRGQLVPVAKVERVLGLGAGDQRTDERTHLLFVTEGGRAAAWRASEIVAIEAVPESALEPAGTDGGTPWYRGSYASAGHGVVLVLDTAAVLRAVQPDETAEVERAGGPVAEAGGAAAQRFLVYRCGRATLATALTELEAVMELPPDAVNLGPADTAAAVCARDGRALELIDLAAELGLPAKRGAGTVLCVATPRGRVGFVVDAAEALQAAVPQPVPWRDGPAMGRVPAFTETIRVRGADADRAACVLSLTTLAWRAA